MKRQDGISSDNGNSDIDIYDNIHTEKFNKKMKRENFVHYPVTSWHRFNHHSKRHFLNRYYSKTLTKSFFLKSDFQLLNTVHVGRYSTVMLAKYKQSKLVAVKTRKKKTIVENGLVVQAKREIRLINFIKFPFIINAHVVQCNVYLYYIMSFACGNSLNNFIKTKILTENQAKFYSAQVILTLEFLHSLGIIHRGLDAANVLICHDGYVKLTGFSKAKIGLGKRESLTNLESVYALPELSNEKHGYQYDLWCFGLLILNLCSSENPYTSSEGVVDLVSVNQIKLPEYFSHDLKDLMRSLLDYDPCSRLGSKCPSEIKHHAWFDLPWNHLQNKRIRPPFLPRCSDPVQHFETFPSIQLQQSSFDPYDLIFKDCFTNN